MSAIKRVELYLSLDEWHLLRKIVSESSNWTTDDSVVMESIIQKMRAIQERVERRA